MSTSWILLSLSSKSPCPFQILWTSYFLWVLSGWLLSLMTVSGDCASGFQLFLTLQRHDILEPTASRNFCTVKLADPQYISVPFIALPPNTDLISLCLRAHAIHKPDHPVHLSMRTWNPDCWQHLLPISRSYLHYAPRYFSFLSHIYNWSPPNPQPAARPERQWFFFSRPFNSPRT